MIQETIFALKSGKAIYDTLKIIQSINENLNNNDLKLAIINLQNSLIESAQENIDLKNRISELETEISNNKEIKKFNMIYKDNVFYDMENDLIKSGPYCPRCWQKNHEAIIMSELPTLPTIKAKQFHCQICDLKVVSGKIGYAGM